MAVHDSDSGGAAIADVRAPRELNLGPNSVMRWAFFSLSGVSYLVFVYVIWNSRLLRPAADDYCLAAGAQEGLFLGVWGWWTSWSGDLTMQFANTLFVGLPLLHLPWAFASALPFLMAAACVSLVGLWVFQHVSEETCRPSRPIGSLVMLFPILAVMWWGYWWVTVLQSKDAADAYPLAVGITVWQNLNAQYVITSSALVLIWLLLETGSSDHERLRVVGYVAWGLMAGFNGPVFAVSICLMLLLLGTALLVTNPIALRQRGLCWVAAGISVVAAGLISHYSPGSQSRKALFGDLEMDGRTLNKLLTEALPKGLSDWWASVTSPGSLALVIAVSGLTVLLAVQGWQFKTRPAALMSLAFLAFSLITSVVNRASEIFSYSAWWHLVTPRTLTWMGIVAAGITLGSTLVRLSATRSYAPLLVIAGAGSLIFVASSLALMAYQMQSRHLLWGLGPAPVVDVVSDIEPGGGWEDCWRELSAFREAPSRLTT